jgi:hypothetical protein
VIRTVEMEGDEGPIRQFVCEDVETLGYLVNLGTIRSTSGVRGSPTSSTPTGASWTWIRRPPRSSR